MKGSPAPQNREQKLHETKKQEKAESKIQSNVQTLRRTGGSEVQTIFDTNDHRLQ